MTLPHCGSKREFPGGGNALSTLEKGVTRLIGALSTLEKSVTKLRKKNTRYAPKSLKKANLKVGSGRF